jgi:hypothetical protein
VQIIAVAPAFTEGRGVTVTVTVALFVHEPEDATTVYVVVEGGVATGFATVVLLRPVDGDQLKLVPPTALSVAEDPAQIGDAELDAVTVIPPTKIVTVSVAEQPPVVPVTVYVVVETGEAVGVAVVAPVKLPAGDHE